MKRDNIWIFGGLLLAGIVPAQSVSAQPAQVQAIRPRGEILNNHLARLASNPRDVTALIGAGEAALDMDDARAAAGFFARADVLQPNNGKVKAGLGRVMLKNQNPAEALRLFDQAARLGYPEATLLSDRGLARDMTGDQAGAQRDYQAALQRTPDDVELMHRYAASLGISGQVDAAERVLKPLLYKSDRAAWRYRAFILAMNNRQADAKKIAEQTMPSQLAAAILPYMQKMPYLTAAQKAAAVHFGHFPANVGTTIAAITPTPPAFASAAPVVRPPAVEAPQPAKPARQDRRSRSNGTGAATLAQAEAPPRAVPVPAQPAPARQATAQPQPRASAPQVAPNVQGPPAPGFESVQNQPAAPAAPRASQLNAITLAQASAPQPQSVPAPAPPPPTSPAPTPLAATAAAAPPTAAPQPQIDPAVTRSLADIIHAIDVPESERQPSAVAVDLTEIAQMQATRRAEREAAAAAAADKAKKAAAAKAKAEADAKAKQLAEEKKKAAEEKARLAANPSRNWLQVGTGANKGALAFTMKGLRKKYDSLEPQDAWVAGWGRTNRLLVGPFASFTRAKALEDKLKAAGADVFAWKSDSGEVVERLPAK
ncbi:Sporulation domain-containing protein [Sphingobium chlorophenolicum L-1]|uniref:Sporulation domain-containing protein n=1 Tax=Sphingobium chlorophenolicum L-1 TaxID=690566 RepID=F6EXM8_SPHCR|nr:SPOR domain-containing protein [Sphingobium chlorophenolicum]AEG49104.1 Sporulation domain-containing protein [Sphingobium chlorophenolicum L-1]